MAMVKCKNCGETISDKAVVCPNCGVEVKKMVICPECGKSIPTDVSSCPNCGYPIEKSSEKNNSIKTKVKENNRIHEKSANNKKRGIIMVLVLVVVCFAVVTFLKMAQTEHYEYVGLDDKDTGTYISKEMSELYGQDFSDTWVDLNEQNSTVNFCLLGFESGKESYVEVSGKDYSYKAGIHCFDIGYDEVLLYYEGYIYHFKKR